MGVSFFFTVSNGTMSNLFRLAAAREFVITGLPPHPDAGLNGSGVKHLPLLVKAAAFLAVVLPD